MPFRETVARELLKNGEMNPQPIRAIVLAAGEGSRMRSSTPKPLHRLCGRPMVLHVLDCLSELGVDEVVVVVGFQSVEVVKAVEAEAPAGLPLSFVEQHERRGTGDAVAVGLTGFDRGREPDEGELIVLPGDAPLVRPETLRRLVELHRSQRAGATLLSAVMEDPTGYGRIVRSRNGRVSRIVEHRDATDDEREIREVGTSIYCFDPALLAPSLRRILPDNAQGEYYLTDVIGVLGDAGYSVGSMVVDDAREVAGVNDQLQLAIAQETLRDRINGAWMRRGVSMLNPRAVYLDTTVELGDEVIIYPNVVLEGKTVIGSGVTMGPDCHLVDTTVGCGATLRSVDARRAQIGANADVGPFAVLAPGSSVADGEVTGPYFSTATPF